MKGKEAIHNLVFCTLSDAEKVIVEVLLDHPELYLGELKTKMESFVEELDAVRHSPGLGIPSNWPSRAKRSITDIKDDFIYHERAVI